MEKKVVVLRANDKIERVDYKGNDTLREEVGGAYAHLYTHTLRGSIGMDSLSMSFWCNDEHLIDDNIKELNTMATMLFNTEQDIKNGTAQMIYGDVVIVKDVDTNNELDRTGFEYYEEAYCKYERYW